MTPDWKQWEGDIAGGEFPLDAVLHAGESGAVFRSGRNAVKLVCGSRAAMDQAVSQWNRAAAIEHPGLIRIFRTGAWTRGDSTVAFCAMELADDNLSAVLAERPLSVEETREMLLPVAETLAFLHARDLAQGSLKASNVLAINDSLKLASDSVAPGDTAKDVRDLGALVVAALGGNRANLPAPFAEIAENCLAVRWSARDVVDRLNGKPIAAAKPRLTEPSGRKAAPILYAVALALSLIVVIGFGSWWRDHEAKKSSMPSPTNPAPQPAPIPEAAAPPPGASRPQPPPNKPAKVIAQAMPEIPPKARRTIRGTAKVSVKVAVNESGDVTAAKLEPGGSRYFGKYAVDAARHWRFSQGIPSDWRLRFEITQGGTKAYAEPEN